MQIKNFIRTLPFGRPYIKNIILLSLVSLLSSGIGLIYLFILKNIVNTFYQKDFSHVKATILLSALLYIVQSLISFFSSYLSLFTSEKINCDIKKNLFSHILSLPINFFKTRSEGTLMSRILNDTVKMEWLITNASITILGQPLKLLFLFGIAFWMNFNLALVLVLFLPLSFVAIKITAKVITLTSRKLILLSENVYSFLQQKLYGIEIIKSLTNENKETKTFEELNDEFLNTELKRYKSIAILLPVQQILMGACILLILWIGTREVASGSFSPGAFAAFGAISFSIYAMLNKIGRTHNRIRVSMESCNRVFDILDIPKENAGSKLFPTSFSQAAIKNLSFSYTKETPVLQNISLKINSGETILFKGASGCGKTTLIGLLMNFYTPVTGNISIDGTSISEYDIISLRKEINMVPQETILFNDSLLNNIIYGSVNKDKPSIQQALNLSSCDDFINEIQNGLSTEVGDRGILLSAGQKQRVAIARAILRGGSLLLLDEATSGINEETEEKIITNIKNSGIFQTIVIISHRSSIEKFADRIYSLDAGEIQLVR